MAAFALETKSVEKFREYEDAAQKDAEAIVKLLEEMDATP